MRQVGVLAAAGWVGLTTLVDRLEDDHRRAKILAEGLSQIPGIKIRLNSPQTNMVFMDIDHRFKKSTTEISQQLKMDQILVGEAGLYGFRLVTHHDIDDNAIQKTIIAFSKVMKP
jgi:threonine aldolase